ncbi:MAG: TIGR03960 family B12-binding radical SAM protein [Phycisphaerae bacterium]|nr:TIGR03960 family B12-binding radical SAM protein [Phycisphaerae bacterium]
MPTTDELKDKFWPFVRNPAQYIGREVNMIRKDWDAADLRIALAFPDAYTVGSSSLAVHIVYDVLNAIPGVLCERAFCPWPDAADRLRHANLPLYALESYRPLRDFDLIAFSVQYEMLYTNVIEMLDLAGVPLAAAERSDNDPLVLIGGSQAHNPEPLAHLIDLAILGEAEAALPPFVDLLRQIRQHTRRRDHQLAELAKGLHFVYVPSLYDVRYRHDGEIDAIAPKQPDLPMPVVKTFVRDLDTVAAPTKPIVPYVQTVHERINIEIMRGCPHACRFCHEGCTRRPLRFRSRQRIVELAEQTFANTGLTEISLFSLSSADHPELRQLFDDLNAAMGPRHVSVALPSLRAEKQLELIPAGTSRVRKAPLTIAVESADPLVRQIINKPIDDQAIFDAATRAYQCGWQHVKLYFMIGLPGEDPNQLPRIVELADHIAQLRRQVARRTADVNVSISIFTPKSHTPLQWIGQRDLDYVDRAQTIIRNAARGKRHIKISFHNRHRSRVEAVLARGDRRVGPALQHAWKLGARFDAWEETFHPDHYYRAIEHAGLDPAFYAHRNIHPDRALPWDHLQPAPQKSVQLHQLHRALDLIPDGRNLFS